MPASPLEHVCSVVEHRSPTLIIKNETEDECIPTVIVTKEGVAEKTNVLNTAFEEEEASVLNTAFQEDEEEDEESVLNTAFQEDEEEEESVMNTVFQKDEEEEEEVEESMEIVKIGKKKYFVGDVTKTVYVYVDEESAGEELGVLQNGKIVPK